MGTPKICLTLTCSTIAENLEIVKKYRPYIDIVELRADYLDDDECLQIRKFPMLAQIPCILTIRRKSDGGKFVAGESSRTMLFARAMAFADNDKENNFQYVDFEDDFHVSSLEDAAQAFGTRIIRSYHNMTDPVTDIVKRCGQMRKTGYEIPKIAFMPHTLDDVTRLFSETKNFNEYDHILCAMGPMGTPSRILSFKTNSFLTYTSPVETGANLQSIGHLDPITLNQVYHFKDLNENTKIYGITGWPLAKTNSPLIHNQGYVNHFMNSVYIPFPAQEIGEAIRFAEEIGVEGMSVTVPHKESVVDRLDEIDRITGDIGASNTVVHRDDKWYGYNTDALGVSKAILEFTGWKNLKHKKVSIIGAGGASRAVAYAVKQLGGKACVFNRTVSKAQLIAEMFGFTAAELIPSSKVMIEKYSDLIIQTTSVGMGSTLASCKANDPLYFYNFNGSEMVMDIIYVPEETPMMIRAREAGCETVNGLPMLKYQGYEQFKIFTGVDYE